VRIVVVGAGAIGGYVAARMIEAGLDVTLLVREGRKRQLERTGLSVISPCGDCVFRPPLLVGGEVADPYDMAIIASKAYGLTELLGQLMPYLHENTVILPFLNGMKHMEQIAEAYSGQPLLGGVARIETTLGEDGTIHHLGAYHYFTYGAYLNLTEERYEEIRGILSTVPLLTEKSDIRKDLWEKYAFINVLSGLTTLYQATVGEIRETGVGMTLFKQAFAETIQVIQCAGGKLSEELADKQLRVVEGMSALSTSSMMRDLSKGLPTEYLHIQGYLIELARRHGCSVPLLEIIFGRLEAYEKQRLREQSSAV
jgi:2-dehydropantoate 2-reductase